MRDMTVTRAPRTPELLRELGELPGSLGRTPTTGEIGRFLRRHGVSPTELEQLIASGAPVAGPIPPRASSVRPSVDADDGKPAQARLVELAEPSVDEDLDDWSAFADPPRPTGSPETDDPLLASTVGDLLDDRHRAGGRLGVDQVTALAARRGLTAEQQVLLVEHLYRCGVHLEDPDDHPQRVAEDGGQPYASSTDLDALGAYMAQIGRYRLLQAEDEVRLGHLMQAGLEAAAALADPVRADRLSEEQRVAASGTRDRGRRAHAELVQANLRLVISLARIYRNADLEFLDRIQDGNIGLMRAADKFDPTLGFKFSTYATWWIRQGIERGLADHGRVIRIPVHAYEAASRVRRIRSRLSGDLDREPTLEELGEATGLPSAQVAALLHCLEPVRSLDAVITRDGDLTRGDLLSGEADVDGRRDPVEVALESARLRDLDCLLKRALTPRERDVLRRRFGLDGGEEETLERIAASFGLTRERVRQIQDKALGLLRQNVATYPLREYLVTNTRLDAVQPAADWVAENVPKGKRAPSERPRTDASTTTTHSPAKGDPRGQRTA